MRGLTSVASNIGTFKSEFANNGIYVKSLPAIEMEYMPNISTDDEETFKQKVRETYSCSAAIQKEPQTVVIGYTDQLAVKKNHMDRESDVRVGHGANNIVFEFTGDNGPDPLWQDIVPGEGWFQRAVFMKKGGRYGHDEVDIPASKCLAVPLVQGFNSFSNKVSVDVSWLPEGEGDVVLVVSLVDRMRAGLSFGGGNLICVCTRSYWQDISTEEQNQIVTHEMGHKCGMVSDGTGKLPDKVPYHYEYKDHVGDHCGKGVDISLSSLYGVRGSECVMFGETNGISSFCGDCGNAIKKVDLSDGWSGV